MTTTSQKTFNVAGYSTMANGVRKMRFAKDMTRVQHLEREGHTDVQFVQLPTAMTKVQCSEWLAKWFPSATIAEVKAVEEVKEFKLTLEEALSCVPMRENGRFLSKAAQLAMAEELMNTPFDVLKAGGPAA